jgi:hypothetical protein
VPPRCPSPLAPSRGSFPKDTRVPRRSRSPPPLLLAPHAVRPGTPSGPSVRSVPSRVVRSSRGQRVFLDVTVGPLWSLAGSLAAHKRGTALPPRHAQGRAAAGAMDGSRGELQGRPAGSPNKRFCHLPLHVTELVGVPSPPRPPPHRHGRPRRLPGLAAGAAPHQPSPCPGRAPKSRPSDP